MKLGRVSVSAYIAQSDPSDPSLHMNLKRVDLYSVQTSDHQATLQLDVENSLASRLNSPALHKRLKGVNISNDQSQPDTVYGARKRPLA